MDGLEAPPAIRWAMVIVAAKPADSNRRLIAKVR
jgi:hypothetical protein